MKSFTFSFLAFISFSASAVIVPEPVHAMPIWATSIARSHCEYLAMGAGWNEAIRQAMRDNSHWLSDLNSAGDLGSKAIAHSINNICPALNTKAFGARNLSSTSTPIHSVEL
jgi:hypothetical protein